MLTNTQAEKHFKKLASDIQEQIPYLSQYVRRIKKNNNAKDTVYDFQALMDGLNSLKERADQITATIDHG